MPPMRSRQRDKRAQRYALVVDVTIQAIASLLIGAGLGWWLTIRCGAPFWVMLLCIILGIASAVLTMVRSQRRIEKLEEDSEEAPGPPA
jgi:F0F1-type ATP synthase assembly protein I